MRIMYIRVSTEEQNTARQEEEAKRIKAEKVFIDKASGRDFNREQYQAMKRYIREGDVIYFSSIDRMGRDYRNIKKEWADIRGKGAHINILDMPILNTDREDDVFGEIIQNIVLEIFCYMADKEYEMSKARQAAGIARAKAEGKYKGRQPLKVDVEKFKELQESVRDKIITHEDAANDLGMKRSTYFKILKEYNNETGRFAK